MKSAYRLYSQYLSAGGMEEAERILRKALGISADHLMRLAWHFGEDYGRLPDELHNMVVLTGGFFAAKYLDALGRFEKAHMEVEDGRGHAEGTAEARQEGDGTGEHQQVG